MIIDGSEGTRRVFGMLLMTLGMVEMVKLAHPGEWLTFLQKEKYASVVQQHTGKRSAEKLKESRLSEHLYHEKAVHKLPVCVAGGFPFVSAQMVPMPRVALIFNL